MAADGRLTSAVVVYGTVIRQYAADKLQYAETCTTRILPKDIERLQPGVSRLTSRPGSSG